MLMTGSGEDVYPSNWVRTCDTCQAAACTVYCHTDSAYLCNDCDKHIHADAANHMALLHQRVCICAACENAPAAVTCSADAASLCIDCDIQIHSVNPLASRHTRVPIPPLFGLAGSSSFSYQDGQLPDPTFDTENKTAAHAVLKEEMDEDETDSWLLLEPDNTGNQTMSGFTYSEQLDEYMDVVDTYTKHQRQEQCSDQQQLFCVNYPEESGSDSVVPVQAFEAKKQPQEEEKQVQQQQQTHQQLQSIYFNTEHRGSKAAFTSTPSSALSQLHTVQGIFQCPSGEHQSDGIHVPMLFITAGILPNATSNIPNPYTRFPMGTTDLFPDPLLLMPLQFTPMNREEKVIRYREKRKARKFEKKIRYASRKAYADTRPRVKGRFARKTDMEIEDDQMFLKEEDGYGIVPSL